MPTRAAQRDDALDDSITALIEISRIACPPRRHGVHHRQWTAGALYRGSAHTAHVDGPGHPWW
ncbi:hypothetical protein [Deinococcus sp. GbtcB9]|uniref:hypothetical protein n=1 Tax=Deinococcus sp. GbtcB9 TaxID=2824754 RepID=UPI001C30DCE6|nr:hypothetical protein [Deinococcus sp. GbtcB9]